MLLTGWRLQLTIFGAEFEKSEKLEGFWADLLQGLLSFWQLLLWDNWTWDSRHGCRDDTCFGNCLRQWGRVTATLQLKRGSGLSRFQAFNPKLGFSCSWCSCAGFSGQAGIWGGTVSPPLLASGLLASLVLNCSLTSCKWVDTGTCSSQWDSPFGAWIPIFLGVPLWDPSNQN